MSILVIPDIHNKTERVDSILQAHKDVDKVIFLGDYWDDYDDTADDATKVAKWITATATKLGDKATWLLGNHDIPYIFPRSNRSCPGWTKEKGEAANRYLGFRDFRIVSNMGGVVFTHAGISDWNRFDRIVKDEEDLLAVLKSGFCYSSRLEDYFSAGLRSLVSVTPGGPWWADFTEVRSEFLRNPINQIVGHTPASVPQVVEKDGKVLIGLDTHLKFYGILTPGEGFKVIRCGSEQ